MTSNTAGIDVFTTTTDPTDARTDELAAYHRRWQAEAANDQLTTHLRGPDGCCARLSDLVYQEIWAYLWHYLGQEQIETPNIYFAHQRQVIARDGMWLSASDAVQPKAGETIEQRGVRCRTVGDMTLTGCVESDADTINTIIEKTAIVRLTEHGATRGDDWFSEAAMEDRREEGYF